MHAKNWPKFLGLVVLSFVVLVQYQNCAPSHSAAAAQTIPDDQNVVHIMGSVGFSEAEIHMAATSTWAAVSGTCDVATSDGSLNWELRDPDTNLSLDTGTTACTNDQFSLEIAAGPQIICGKVYQVHLQSDFEGSEDSSVNFVRDCQ